MILVTGAAGKTGLAVIRALSRAKIESRALVYRLEHLHRAKTAGAAETIVGDMRESSTLDKALRDIDGVYHICPNVHPDELLIGQRIIEYSSKRSIASLVYHSVIHPQTEKMPHHWQKMRVEEAIFESNLPYVILQPAPYMQNLMAGWHSMISEDFYRIPYSPGTRLSLVDLDDVAEAAVAVLTSLEYRFGIYELCGTADLTQSEVASAFSEKLGHNIEAVQISIEEWRERAHAAELNPYALDALESMFRYYDRHGLSGNCKVLQWLLGREPTSLSDYIEREMSARLS